ncbi:translocation/assembly module TamB domain-containing protein [Litoreibacter janthinus]|uniref:Autotransporter secretion inner membrane protein TamB n=1 Tax=Litoreibacter janthinus TaxID=670154 RepID=A0A1I6GUR8_9RHOB|nr:translocation/assembly module TamB domain-containing protein [Litoreibacter janthinus]SFR45829.1 autotransporter secretion inner membrane protein TamB [Litoreibacter janthinus]
MRFLSLCLFLVFAPLAAFAQQEESDRGYIQGLLEDALSTEGGTVRLEGFAGALSARATVDRITISDAEGVWLSATGVSLAWSRSALLRGQVEIDDITVEQIDLPRAPVSDDTAMPTPEARGAFTLPELPVSVDIGRLQIGTLNIGAALFGEAAQLSAQGNANLSNGSGEANLSLTRLDQAGEFSLSAAFDNATRVLVLDLSLEEPEGGLAVNLLEVPGYPSILLTVQGEDPISEFSANIRLETDGEERLEGAATLTSDADGTSRFALDVRGDVAPVFVPEFAEFLGNDVKLVTRGERSVAGGVKLDELTLQTAALNIQGSAEIDAQGWPQKLQIDGQIVPPDGDTVVLPLPGPDTSVERVELSAGFDASAGDTWSVKGFAQGLQQEGLELERANFDATGAVQKADERVTGAMQLVVSGVLPKDAALAQAIGSELRGALSFSWAKGAPLILRDINLAGADYSLDGALTVNDLETIEAITLVPDMRVEAQNLSRFAALAGLQLAGAASLDVTGSVEPLSGLLALDFKGATQDLATGIAQVDPLLTGDGSLTLGVSRNESGLSIEPVLIATDHARIEGEATLRTGESRASFTASLPDVSRALPSLYGVAELTVTADQTGDVWAIVADALLPGGTKSTFKGTVSGFEDGKALVDGALNASVERLSAFSGLAGRAMSGSVNITTDLKADINEGSFDVTATGAANGLAFSVPTVEPLLRGTTRFDLSAARDADGTIDIRTLTVRGNGLDADVSGRFGAQSGTVTYRAGVSNLASIVPGFPGPASVAGSAERQGSTWLIDASGQGPAGVAATASGQVAADASTVNLALNGTAPLALVNPRLQGQSLSGLVRFDLNVNGPPALSSVGGRLSVSDARLALLAQNTALNDINGQVILSGGQAQLSVAARVSTGGALTLSGPISLNAPYNAQLVADLSGATLRDASLFEASLGGRLTVSGPLTGGAVIGGVIDVATAEVRIPQIGPSYSVLEGLRHLNPSQPVRRTLSFAGLDGAPSDVSSGPSFPLDLTVRIPSRLFVRGRGLDAELGGSVRLTGTTNDVIPIGSFDLIRGRLDLLGRRLVLTEGAVRLRGSFDPVLRFAATADVEGVTVGLQLEGLASAPELTITSVPALPDEEALSFLLFGRDVTQISAFQAVQLAVAIRTLSGKSGLGITDRLRENLGVDDLDIGTDAEGNTEAKVGKYISDNIYTDVTVKSDGESQINLNLEVSPSVTVRGRLGSDGDTGIGIFYEKDY